MSAPPIILTLEHLAELRIMLGPRAFFTATTYCLNPSVSLFGAGLLGPNGEHAILSVGDTPDEVMAEIRDMCHKVSNN